MTPGENQTTADSGAIEIVSMPAELDLTTSEGVVDEACADRPPGPAGAARPDRPVLLRRPRAQRLVRIANRADAAGCGFGLIAPRPPVAKILRIRARTAGCRCSPPSTMRCAPHRYSRRLGSPGRADRLEGVSRCIGHADVAFTITSTFRRTPWPIIRSRTRRGADHQRLPRPGRVTDMAGDGGTDELREQPPSADYPRGPAFSAEAATGAMTARPGRSAAMTGKSIVAEGQGYSGDRELDDQAGHACQWRSASALGRVPDCLAAWRGLWAHGTGAMALRAASEDIPRWGQARVVSCLAARRTSCGGGT